MDNNQLKSTTAAAPPSLLQDTVDFDALYENLSEANQHRLYGCLRDMIASSYQDQDYYSLCLLAGMMASIEAPTTLASPTEGPPPTPPPPQSQPAPAPATSNQPAAAVASKAQLEELTDYIHNHLTSELSNQTLKLSEATSYEFNDYIYDFYLCKLKDIPDQAELLSLCVSPSRPDRAAWKEAGRQALLRLENEGLAKKVSRFKYEFVKPGAPKPTKEKDPGNPLPFPSFNGRPIVYQAMGGNR